MFSTLNPFFPFGCFWILFVIVCEFDEERDDIVCEFDGERDDV